MARDQDTLAAVRASYIHERLDITDAAAKHGVAQSTARRWKKKAKDSGDDWDMARQASRLASGGMADLTTVVLEDFTLQYQALMDALRNDTEIKPLDKANILTKLADSYVKIMKAAGGGDQEIGKLAAAMETINLMSEFIAEHFPQHREAFLEILVPFGEEVTRHYG